ncbi:MAG: response regulator [Spirochaetaceae bacterium]|nr:MAG: response regulator [Spirochaetaceae bacterium]
MSEHPKVLVVDDLAMFRQAVAEAVERAGGEVLGFAENGRQAIYRYVELKPDVVFMDIMMPEMDGISALTVIRKYDADARVVMCSSVKDSEMIYRAVRQGALDFVPKPFSDERIAEAMRLALRDMPRAASGAQ